MKKRLIIISGVTGALGNALLAKYSQQKDAVVYGISRQAVGVKNFIKPQSNKLYACTLVCSLSGARQEGCEELAGLIDYEEFSQIVYIHALGIYPFEVDRAGKYLVHNDKDGDGIDDRCIDLNYNAFRFMTQAIINRAKLPVKCLIFGSLADKYKPRAHQSWWKTIELVKSYMLATANERIAMHTLNISSVICSHELMTRPYVFINTDADGAYYLTPTEVADRVELELGADKFGYHEYDLFKPMPNFSMDYYQESNFTPRKIAELYGK